LISPVPLITLPSESTCYLPPGVRRALTGGRERRRGFNARSGGGGAKENDVGLAGPETGEEKKKNGSSGACQEEEEEGGDLETQPRTISSPELRTMRNKNK